MTSDDTAPFGDGAPDTAHDGSAPDPAASPRRGRKTTRYVQFTRKIGDAICARMAAGESQRSICADRNMPSLATLRIWAQTRPAFAKNFARARVMGGREGKGPVSTYDPMTGHEIVARIAEGEPITDICEDPAMPNARTVFLWRKTFAEFEEQVRIARETAAERFSDLGWKMALEATPETAYLTHVRLNQLRWQAALLAPRTHGRLKPAEPAKERKVANICYRHFNLEVHPETGQHRVVGYTPDPDTMLPQRTSEGAWTDPPERIQARHDEAAAEAERQARHAALAAKYPNAPDDPEGWL